MQSSAVAGKAFRNLSFAGVEACVPLNKKPLPNGMRMATGFYSWIANPMFVCGPLDYKSSGTGYKKMFVPVAVMKIYVILQLY